MKRPKLTSVSASVSMMMLALNGLSSCSGQGIFSKNNPREGIDPKPEVAAPTRVQDSLLSARSVNLAEAGLSAGDQDQLVIKKSALDKEFLIRASLIPQTGAATSRGLSARVVAFKQVGKRVFLLEAIQGHVVSPVLPSTQILTEFPVLKETDDSLVVDFNLGMKQVYHSGWYHASDDAGKAYKPNTSAAAIERSYLQSIREVAGSLEIRQIAQVADVGALTPYEIRYYIAPYRPNQAFVPKETSDFTRVGFFEVRPTLEKVTGRNLVRIAKWDLSKPVEFAVSANTPEDFKQAMKDGILYWNLVFGREVVKAVDAPQGVTAPDPQYNVVQWVENDAAGSAYADALIDPRSGEILNAQVYMTSVFAVRGKARMPSIKRHIEKPQTSAQLQSDVFASARLCDHPIDAEIADRIADLRAEGASPSQFLKAAQHYVREVVAHEIGHTLGMRHNFAGNLIATANPDQIDRMMADYVIRGIEPKDHILSSSIMEYTEFSDAVLNFAMTQSQGLVLPYDRMAVQWAYDNKEIDESTAPLFCTDTQMGKFKDCLTFDRGPKPIVSNAIKLKSLVDKLPITLVEKYIENKAPMDSRDRLALKKVAFNAETTAKTIGDLLKEQVGWFKTGGAKSIVIERMFPFSTPFYKDEIESAQDSSVRKQLEEAGGIASLLFLLPSETNPKGSLAQRSNEGLEAYLSRDEIRNGIGWDGENYSFSDDELALIRSNGEKFFRQTEEAILPATLDALASGPYTNPAVGAAIEEQLGKSAQHLILAQTEQAIEGTPLPAPSPAPSASPAPAADATKPAPAAPVQAKAFAYKKEIRIKAADLLKQSLGKPSDFSMAARNEIVKLLKENMQKVVGKDPNLVDPSTLPRPVRQWFMEQNDVMRAVQASASK